MHSFTVDADALQTAIYLPIGIALLPGGLWLLVRGPIIYVDKDGVTENDV